MNSLWDINRGYQPPFDRLCEQVEQQQKTIQQLTDRLDTLEVATEKNSSSMATAVKTELMFSSSLSRLKQDVEYLKETQGLPTKALDWLLIFVVVSFVLCVMIIPTIHIWFK